MLYRNKKTGVTVDVKSEIHGDWEPVKAPVSVSEKAEPVAKEKKKTTTRKKAGK